MCIYARLHTCTYRHTHTHTYVFIASRLAGIGRLQDASLVLAFNAADYGEINENFEITRRSVDKCLREWRARINLHLYHLFTDAYNFLQTKTPVSTNNAVFISVDSRKNRRKIVGVNRENLFATFTPV